MSPVKAMEWIENEMTKVFPLGRLKDESQKHSMSV
jgi:hypothetical protein